MENQKNNPDALLPLEMDVRELLVGPNSWV